NGYQQKDRKPSQNDKTEHGMEKTVQNQGQSPKMPKSESKQMNQQSTEAGTEEKLWECIFTHRWGRGKPNSIFIEDFEGPILAQLQPISAIVHTKPTS
ncbi:hypothetical protein Tco_1188359, partial [Tanacetum coccineum]